MPAAIQRIFRVTLLLLPAVVPFLTVTATPRPNVIVILADDLGYGDLSGYGHPTIKTPVLDQLATEGLKLTNFHSGASVCTPSRMALLSGCYPTQVGWTTGVIGYKMQPGEGLHPKVVTIAELFRSAGYATAISGKWHVGSEVPCLPQNQGFDATLFIDKSNNLSKKLWRGNELVNSQVENRLLTEIFTAEAVRFINEKKTTPFFLYVPYTAPHFPVQAHPDWKGKSAFGEYGDVVEELDHGIGRILAALKAEDLEDNTLILFYSDNGPQPGQKARAEPLRGMKWSPLEGGTRVPFIIRWPGKIPPASESHALTSAIDLLPTLCAAATIDWRPHVANAQTVSGFNVLSTWTQKVTEHPRKDLLLWHGMGSCDAILVGKWKLFFDRTKALSGLGIDQELSTNQQSSLAKLATGQGPLLFDLENDVDELIDLSHAQPDRIHAMHQLAKERQAEATTNIIPLWQRPKGKQ
jgi:arylsulfatase A